MGALLIVNPWATGVDEARLAAVQEALPAGTEKRLTTRSGEAREIAHEASGRVDAVYVFGGDGTFNEVLNGIDAATPIGFVPGGGTSVLPRALGLPRDPVDAARRLAHAATRRIGLGRVNDHRFGFGAGVGLDAEIVRAVDELGRRPDGRRPGDLAFTLTGIRTLSRHRFRLDPVLEVRGYGRAAFALVSNCPVYSYAGPFAVRVAPGASFSGGLDLVAPVRVRPIDIPRVLRDAFAGGSRTSDRYLYVPDADRIEILCDRPLPLQADGEDLGDVQRVVFEAEREAVTVLV